VRWKILKHFVARVKKHRKEDENITGVNTRAEKMSSASICNKSMITDHVSNESHVVNWDSVKSTDHKADKMGRHIREAIWIHKHNNMNQDEGNYILSHVWDKLLLTDVRNRKSVLMKTSDRRSKRRC